MVRFFTVNIFLRLTVKILSFLRLTAKCLAVLRLTVNPIETLYQRYCKKLATNSSQMQPQNLPLTSAAARHHSLRVYLQVKQWKGENEGMSLEDYRLKVTEDQIIPRMTDLPAAPESLLQLIRCDVTARQIVPAQDAPAVNVVSSVHLHVANVEVQILQSSLKKMTAKMSNRVTWK